MYLIKSYCGFLFLFLCVVSAQGMQDTVRQRRPLTYWERLDSIQNAKKVAEKIRADSIRKVQDSLKMVYIKAPDPHRPHQFLDSLRALVTVPDGDLIAWWSRFDHHSEYKKLGAIKYHRESWVVGVTLLLVLFFGVLKNSLSGQLQIMIEAFYNNRALLQISKEENLYNSWPFVLLYVLFGFTLGMLVYLANTFLLDGGSDGGFSLYLFWSIVVLILFTFKIIALRFLGFVFNAQRIVRDYVSILYLSYFNTAILFLPVVLSAIFLPQSYMRFLLFASFFALILIFSIQFLRAVQSVLKTYRFPKFYLFLYFCTLEIGPIIILLKILGF